VKDGAAKSLLGVSAPWMNNKYKKYKSIFKKIFMVFSYFYVSTLIETSTVALAHARASFVLG
jgi:hypothetical protein